MGCLPQSIVMFILTALLSMDLWTGFSSPQGVDVPPEPCIVTSEIHSVEVRVGPGFNRAVRLYWSFDEQLPVLGQAAADDGSQWWQVDIPDIEQAWIAQADVMSLGDCTSVYEGDAPPLILAPPRSAPAGEAPTGEENPGVWGACGSCDTCARPNECVLSPEGECLWDTARCGSSLVVPAGSAECVVTDRQAFCEYWSFQEPGNVYMTECMQCYDNCGNATVFGCSTGGDGEY